MKRSNKRGFTLVELVIVIAVIAILAGVMIATFAGVVNDAKDAAAEQEAKQAEQNQKIEDITAKLENADWLAWEDFESYLEGIESGAATQDQVKSVIEDALKAYAEAAGKDETGLTEEQVATIIQREMANALSATQVENIVNNAVKTIKVPEGVTVADVTRAVNNALATTSFVTTSDVYSAVTSALNNFNLADADITAIANAVAATTLKAEEVETLLHKYYRNGVAGDYSWYTDKDELTVTTASQIQAIAGLVIEGEDFTDKTIIIKAGTYDFSSMVFEPITTFNGTLKGEEGVILTGITLTPNTTINDATILDCGSTNRNDKFGLGFINYLGANGVLENVTLVVDYEVTTTATDGIQLGGAVGYLDGGTIQNVTVKGSVKNAARAGGIVGAASSGTIKNCTNEANVASTALNTFKTDKGVITNGYNVASGIVGYVRNFADKTAGSGTLEISGLENKGELSGAYTFQEMCKNKSEKGASGAYHSSVTIIDRSVSE